MTYPANGSLYSSATRLRALICLLFSGTALFAQAPGPVAAPADEETVVLSPFQVNASRDVGFVAASSLAGGRLAGDLKDTPVAYSVLTGEFIDALGLTNLVDASKWLPNTGTAVTNGQGEVNGNPVALTFRGVGANSLARNFFRLGVNYDSYNVDRYDLARGPNAILFGNGGIGGTANVVTKTANTNKPVNILRVSYGSWNNGRVTADINAPLGKTFALRANVLWQERDGWRDWEAEQKKAATLAATWKLGKNTEIRAEAELGKITRRNPTFGLNDRFTGWDGVTTFAGNASILPSNSNARGVTRFGSSTVPFFVYSSAFDRDHVINLGNTATTLGGNATPQTPIGGILVVGTGIQAATWPTLPAEASIGLPASRFDLAVAGSKFRVPGVSFSTSSNAPTSIQPYQTYTGAITRRVGDLFLELAGNWATEERRNAYLAYGAFNDTYIDINQTLPSGAANPYYLEPYNQLLRRQANFHTQPTSVRASAAYLLKNTGWGDFSFNLAGGVDWNRSGYEQLGYVVMRADDHRRWPTQDRVNYRYYWSETDRPAPSDLPAVTYNGVTYPVGWVNDTTDPSNGAITDTTNPYAQAAAKARLFEGRVHLLTAVRHDKYKSTTKSRALAGDYPLDWNGHDAIYRPAAPADYATLTYVPKTAAGVATSLALPADSRPRDASGSRLAQYADDRFRDDYSSPDIDVSKTTFTAGTVTYLRPWLSAFANYATSFNPNGSRLRVDGSTFAPQSSKGWDLGLRATVGTRLSVAFSTYRGEQQNEAFDPTTSLSNGLNNMLNANAVGDVTSGGRNIRGLGNVPAQFFDSRDRNNNGWEFEAVANLAPGWRLLLNGSVADAHQTNSYKDFTAYWSQNAETFRQIVIDAGAVINADGTASVNTTIPPGQALDASNAVTGWNSIRTTLANIVTDSQKVARLVEKTGNIFTDYEFRKGPLRNFRIGAGANYRGREVIGFRGSDTIPNPSNPLAAIDDPAVDAYTPVYTSPYTTGTLTLGYWFKVRNQYRVNLDLKVDNVFDYDEPRYFNTLQRPPGGDVTNPSRVAVPGQYYYITPRNFTVTVGLVF